MCGYFFIFYFFIKLDNTANFRHSFVRRSPTTHGRWVYHSSGTALIVLLNVIMVPLLPVISLMFFSKRTGFSFLSYDAGCILLDAFLCLKIVV